MENKLLFFALSVAIAYLFYQNHTLQHKLRYMEETVSNLTSLWKTNLDDVVSELQAVRIARKAEVDQFNSLKKSLEDAIFQNKLRALEIAALKDDTSDITSLRKASNRLEVSTEKMTVRLQEADDRRKRMEQEMLTMAGSLNAQRENFHSVKKLAEDAANRLDVSTEKMMVRLQMAEDRTSGVEEKVKGIEQNMENILRNDQEFRDQIQRFKHQVEDYQRAMLDRNPLWDAVTVIFDWFLSPLTTRGRNLLH